MTEVLPVHDCVLWAICCQAEACLISSYFVHKSCENAKAVKIAATRSLSRNKTPHVGRTFTSLQLIYAL
jgi:hypothetical protein